MIYFPKALAQESTTIHNNSAAKENHITFQGWPYGENTSVPAFQLTSQELAECLDMKFNPDGQLETRPPFTQFTDTAMTGAARDIKSCSISGTEYTICSDATKIYYLDSLTPTVIGTVAGPAEITPYNDVAIIADGSYLKYCDSVSTIKIAYDAGTGGTFYDNYTGVDDTTIDAVKVAVKFTTPAWDAGYTIPPTEVYFKAKVSASTETATVVIYKASDDTVMATKVCDTQLTTSATILSVSFDTVTNEFAPSTAYYATLEATNLQVSATTVSSGGVGYTNTGSWANVSTKDPIMRVHPGLPPKADFCTVSGNRLMVKNPDEPGRVYFGNITHLDFSTTDGGGWVGVVDDGANSFEIGGMEDLYGILYVYGTQERPYICQLTGDSPDVYSLPLLFQKVWATQRTLQNTNSDIWNASADGIDPLTGVQEYGDLRTYSASDPIKDRLTNWVSDTAFSGYNANDGQYWLYMPTYNYISVCHTKQPIKDGNNPTRYPWTRYNFLTDKVPTCFSQVGGDFLVGATDGHFYVQNITEYKDLIITDILPQFTLAYTVLPGKTIDLIQTQVITSSKAGSNITIKYVKNNTENMDSAVLTKTLTVPASDSLTLADVEDILLEDLEDRFITVVGKPLYFENNINCYSFQVQLSNIQVSGYPVYISGIIFKYRELEA